MLPTFSSKTCFLMMALTQAFVSSMIISPHGGYVSIDEGGDFYLECIGSEPQWILAKRLTLDIARLSTQIVQENRKAILTIQNMDASLTGPYLCQTNQSMSTVIVQLTKRHPDMAKQIRFMGTTTNQSAAFGSNVQLNCYAQYYSEKAMDSPYVPRILWFFERRQLVKQGAKYRFGIDSLIIQNFTYADQGVYYCRAFITLRTNFLTKVYPILVQLQNTKEIASSINGLPLVPTETLACRDFNETILSNNTVSYCNVHGGISHYTCPTGHIWNEEYSQCSLPSDLTSILQIIPNLSHIAVELGRTYTFACQSNDRRFEPEWAFENGTIIVRRTSHSSIEQITSYTLNDTRTVYLRLAPVLTGTFICRSRPSFVSDGNKTSEKQEGTISMTLTAQTIAETNGISFQSSTLAEYHVRTNGTVFIACRPEYFDFQAGANVSYVPRASLRRMNDHVHFILSDIIDGVLVDRLSVNETGLYICVGQIPLAERLITAMYPVMVFVSDV